MVRTTVTMLMTVCGAEPAEIGHASSSCWSTNSPNRCRLHPSSGVQLLLRVTYQYWSENKS
jgi:hypothetical protein